MAAPIVPLDLKFSVGSLTTALRPQSEALLKAGESENPPRVYQLATEADISVIAFRESGFADVSKLDAAINLYGQALKLDRRPGVIPLLSGRLPSILGDCHSNRYYHSHDISDLETAILHYRDAVEEFPPDGPGPEMLTRFDLARCLYIREGQNIEPLRLKSRTTSGGCYQEARMRLIYCVTEDFLSDKLVEAIEERIARTEQAGDISEAIGVFREFMDCLASRFYVQGPNEDLDKCIEMERALLHLCHPGHPEHPECLFQLANTFSSRFEAFGTLDDINEAILCRERAHEAFPKLHERYIRSLLLVSDHYVSRFRQTSVVSDMQLSIERVQTALALLTEDDLLYLEGLQALAKSLYHRFKFTGDAEDLNICIQLEQTVLGRQSPVTIDALENLAFSLWNRFQQSRQLHDINNCIELVNQIIELYNNTDQDAMYSPPKYWDALFILAKSYHARFRQTSEPSDLDEAIRLLERTRAAPEARLAALDLDHDRRLAIEYDLTECLLDRFKGGGDSSDVDTAVEIRAKICDHCIPGNIHRSKAFTRLAMTLAARNQDNIEQAIRLLKTAAFDTESPILDRLEASREWGIQAARTSTKMEAYAYTLRLFDIAVAQGHSLEKQYVNLSSERTLKAARRVSVTAAAMAIERDGATLAVRFLEQGHASIFPRKSQLRRELEEIKVMAPELLEEFLTLCGNIEQLATRYSQLTSSQDSWLDDTSKTAPLAMFEEFRKVNIARKSNEITARMRNNSLRNARNASLYRGVSSQWTAVVGEIKAVYGLSSFLEPASFSELQWAADAGPVIIVNISNHRSDAIIIARQRPPIVVRLPTATLEGVNRLADAFNPQTGNLEDFVVTNLLRETWDTIVRPIAAKLGELSLRRGARIWWCPVGPAIRLPLHAAGPYKKGQLDMSHLYTSSYTPTLGALIQARKNHIFQAKRSSGVPPSLLVVSQSTTPNQSRLHYVTAEARSVKDLCPQATVLQESFATREAVMLELTRHAWVHLACHGHRDISQTFSSRFLLHNGSLSVLDIVRQDLPTLEFAFLSACHSAGVDEDSPDHLAAAMLSTGCWGAVGTMWAMDDCIGPVVAKEFYKQMLTPDDDQPDATKAASALRKAVNELRKQKFPLIERINLVHFGI